MKYDWQNNAKPWRTAMQQRMPTRATRNSLIFVFVILPILTLPLSLVNGSIPHGKQLTLWFILIGIALLGGVRNFFRQRRHRIIAERVPPLHARLCPKCLVALDPENPKESPDEAPLSARCPSCAESFNLTEIEDYWAIYPALKGCPQSRRKWLDSRSPRGKYDPEQPLVTAYRFRLIDMVVGLPMIFAYYLAFTGVLSPGSMLVGFVNHASYVLPIPAFFLFLYAVSRHTGSSVHCLKCKYEIAPDTGDRCSECGEDWTWPFQRLRGKRTPSRPLMAVAAVLFLVMFVGPMLLPVGIPGSLKMRLLPTPSLITQVSERGGFLPDEWAAINQRTLSPHETRTLFLGLLDNRHRGYRFTDEKNWIETQLKTTTIPQNLIDRFYQESIHIESPTPTAGTPIPAPSETIHLTFEISDDFIFQWNAANHLILEHIEINGQPVPNSRPDKPFGPHRLTGPRISKSRNYPCPIPLTMPDHPGPVTIKLIYWQIIAPMKPGITTVQWNEDNTPVLPPNAIWSDRVEKEFTITVK